jgi:uncharacterized protein YbjT (DUF2867 family)
MTSPILVTGGTGTLGSLVVPRLRGAGCDVRVFSRSSHEDRTGVEFVSGDLATGNGLDAALAGVETVVHLGGSAKGDDKKAKHLARAAKSAGVSHIVYISVVGADDIPMDGMVDRMMFGYFGAKHAAEQIVAESGVPWTTLRATQFHDLVLKTAHALTRLPVVPVFAGVKFQPIDAVEVADRLVELALGEPAGLVPEMGGPRVYEMTDLVRSYLQATGKRRLLLPIKQPGKAAQAMRSGANLAPDRAVGRRTWEEFLAERVGSQRQVEPAAA